MTRIFWNGAQWALRPAVLLALLYILANLAGLRQDTTFLSGTMVNGDWNRTTALGGSYAAAYLGWTIVCPILAIAGIMTGAIAVWKERKNPHPQPHPQVGTPSAGFFSELIFLLVCYTQRNL